MFSLDMNFINKKSSKHSGFQLVGRVLLEVHEKNKKYLVKKIRGKKKRSVLYYLTFSKSKHGRPPRECERGAVRCSRRAHVGPYLDHGLSRLLLLL